MPIWVKSRILAGKDDEGLDQGSEEGEILRKEKLVPKGPILEIGRREEGLNLFIDGLDLRTAEKGSGG